MHDILGAVGSVFADHAELDATCMNADLLEPIGEEGVQYLGESSALFEPSPTPKRQRMSYDCELCRTSFTEKRSLVRHFRSAAHRRRIGRPAKQIPCSFCSTTFARDDVRQRHEREQHLSIKRPPAQPRQAQDATGPSSKRPRSLGTTSTIGSAIWLQRAPTPAESTLVPPHASDTYHVPAGNPDTAHEIFSSSQNVRHFTYTADQANSQKHRRDTTPSRSSSLDESDISSGSSLRPTSTNNSWTTYGSTQYQPSIAANASCLASDRSLDQSSLQSTRGSMRSKKSTSLALRPRSLPVRNSASLRPAKDFRPCTLCKKCFGNTKEEVFAHLDRHAEEYRGEHVCKVCQIGFIHRSDLDLHLASARQGQCGFPFEHEKRCSGHHPPTDRHDNVSDNHQMRLCYRLRDWEQSQLQAYLELVNEVLNYWSSEPECRSLDGVLGRSIQSVSNMFSGLDIRSTPEYVEYHLWNAMQKVRRSLSDKVLHGRSASLKIRVQKKPAEDVRRLRALIDATAATDLKRMGELIRRGTDVNGFVKVHDERPACTPLMAAVCSDSTEAVDLLLQNGALADGVISEIDHLVVTPLCIAAAAGNITILDRLLRAGADVNAQGRGRNGHAACFAARNGHTGVLSILLDRGANIHLRAAMIEDFEDEDEDTNLSVLPDGNILAIAAFHGRRDTVRTLLDRTKSEPGYCDASCAVTVAAYQGDRDMIELLLSAYPEFCTYFALWVADSQGHKAIVDMFLDHQRRTKPRLPLQNEVVLRYAIMKGQEDLASRLLSTHHGPTQRCDKSTFACRHFEADFVARLNADVDSSVARADDVNLSIALNCAIYYKHIGTVRILLQHGVNPKARAYPAHHRWITTTLGLAVSVGSPELVNLLLRYGADPAPAGGLSHDLIEASLETGNVDVLRQLLNTGPRFEQRIDHWECSSFNAAVQRLVRRGATGMLKMLLDAGLDVNQIHVDDRLKSRTTICHLAAESIPARGSVEMMKLLLKAGANVHARASSRTVLDIIQYNFRRMEQSHEAYWSVQLLVEDLQVRERHAHLAKSRERIAGFSRSLVGHENGQD